MSRPQSQINICSGVMLDNTYQNTIYFDSLEDQRKYFAEKVVKTFSAYTYLRRDWDIIVQATMEEALSWTYLFFKNSDNAKTYYYFIKKIQYENDNAVRLSIEMDVMQTYARDYTLSSSYVEREHSETDVRGEHVLDEGLDLGDYIIKEQINVDLGEMCCMILSTFDIATVTEEDATADPPNIPKHVDSTVDGIFNGLCCTAVEKKNFLSLYNRVANLDSWGLSEGIIAMWMYPKNLVKVDKMWLDPTGIFHYVTGFESITVKINESATEGYYKNIFALGDDVKNNKLYTYPYSLIYATNNNGTATDYRLEKFDSNLADPTLLFKVTGCVSPEGVCKMSPWHYKGSDTYNFEEGILLNGFPNCAWITDNYKLWLAQNQNQQELARNTSYVGLMAGAFMVGGGLATLNPMLIGSGLASAGGSLSSILSLNAQKKDAAIQPPQSKGIACGSVAMNEGCMTFTIMFKTIDDNHVRMVDDTFTMYGYKTQIVKIPNRCVRENFTYTKTVGCNVYGNLCYEDLNKIKSIFDNGITFWVQGDLIGNYGLSNKCLAEVTNE